LLADITNRAAYLRDHFGWDALAPSLATGATRPKNRSSADLAAALGLVEQIDSALPRVVYASLPEDAGIPGIDGGTLYLVDYQRSSQPRRPVPATPRPGPASKQATGQGLRTTLDSTGARITIHPPAGPTLIADLDHLARQLADATRNETGQPVHEYDSTTSRMVLTSRSVRTGLPARDAVIPLHDPNGLPRGQLLLRTLTIREAEGTAILESWGGFVLVRH
jgi:hypothetical protein